MSRTRIVMALSALFIAAVFIGCSASYSTKSNEAAPAERYNAMRLDGGASIDSIGVAGGSHDISPPAKAEELWVIEKAPATPNDALASRAAARGWHGRASTQPAVAQASESPAAIDEIPGTGALVAKTSKSDKPIPIPLKHTDVKASISGYVATVDVQQQYQNPYSEKIEAIYIFPLPANAAVNEFLMTIGDRKIRGIIREREEARKIYEEARSQGYVASLLTQERPNVFTQSVANIEPGKQIDVDIKYFHTLEYVDGWYEYVFPMVVGPRFNPPGTTDGIGAKAHGQAVGVTGQNTEISYLKPGERSGHDISFALDIDAGVDVEAIECRNHQVAIAKPAKNLAHVQLSDADAIPNKDFVLRYKVAGDHVKSAVMTQRDEKGSYFTLMVFPPESLKDLPRKPIEMVFTLDVSGSMSGKPIEQAKAAARYALNHMGADDSFNVIRFAGDAEQMSPRAIPATSENVQAGLKYLEQFSAGGGTMMIEGIRKSLQVTPDPERLRFVAFLTDGYIGNEPEILREIHNLKGPSRIFSFGVGQATNRYLLDHMAKMGAGYAAYLSLNDDAEKIMAAYLDRISHPALTDVSIDYGSLQVSDVYPTKMPDLFVGRPVILTGRFTGNGETVIKVKGKVGGEERVMEMPINLADATAHKGLAAVWARAKIGELYDQATYDTNAELPTQIKQVALEYGLMSAYTSFVAVDSATRTTGDHGTSVAVPVNVPEGVRYDTTVPE